ncbi:MAG: UrcA family protein [Gammaproteobacteria bacterium]
MRRYMKMKIGIQCLLVTACVGSLAACADAYAADIATDKGLEVAKRTVKFADLDLRGAAGAETLYSRIRIAARQVCTPTFAGWEWESVRSSRSCIEKAITRAVADVNASTLTSYHMTKTSHTIRLAEK